MKRVLLLALLIALGLPVLSAAAQGGEGEQPASVWITTQDFSALRAGPGTEFDRIAVVPPAVTLRAVGRTANTRWIQVEYEGQRGWIIYYLLVWSGDLTVLPVDGIDPLPFVRRVGVVGVTSRDTPIYRREVTPEDQVGVIPAGTEVELTARLGSSGFFQFQIEYEGALYWVGSWNIRITGGNYNSLMNTTYLYPYGRLVSGLERDISTASSALRRIRDIWGQLDAGESVSCGYVPAFASRRTSDADVRQESIFGPTVFALDAAIAHINAAIAAFEDACSHAGTGVYLTQADVNAALDDVTAASQNLVLADSLLSSLTRRDPLVGTER
ncbi:MAG: SH3 domain-containing protein [Anaerolineae bacterium]|nr:SH3 domain-containing protein [Anaerolineae bacterium]